MSKRIVILLSLLILLSGCSSLFGGDNTPTQTPIQTETQTPEQPVWVDERGEVNASAIIAAYNQTVQNSSYTATVSNKFYERNTLTYSYSTTIKHGSQGAIFAKRVTDEKRVSVFASGSGKKIVKQTTGNNTLYVVAPEDAETNVQFSSRLTDVIKFFEYNITQVSDETYKLESWKIVDSIGLRRNVDIDTFKKASVTMIIEEDGTVNEFHLSVQSENKTNVQNVTFNKIGKTSVSSPTWSEKAEEDGIQYNINKREHLIEISYIQGPEIPGNATLFFREDGVPHFVTLNQSLKPGNTYYVWINRVTDTVEITEEPQDDFPERTLSYEEYELAVLYEEFTYIFDS